MLVDSSACLCKNVILAASVCSQDAPLFTRDFEILVSCLPSFGDEEEVDGIVGDLMGNCIHIADSGLGYCVAAYEVQYVRKDEQIIEEFSKKALSPQNSSLNAQRARCSRRHNAQEQKASGLLRKRVTDAWELDVEQADIHGIEEC
ncbi:hypothetical protein KIN20_012734 [Parelaphostrongylus tenuis]|uniref:Uncharacterized protein n=1 Tax=Parelaphostrongylus tenuis TaxID=148309 RepID=A0AAD5MV30_PARTN|nr:hypothetical protein KIN20_012734 [Parelaphostrongylus tenuis]